MQLPFISIQDDHFPCDDHARLTSSQMISCRVYVFLMSSAAILKLLIAVFFFHDKYQINIRNRYRFESYYFSSSIALLRWRDAGKQVRPSTARRCAADTKAISANSLAPVQSHKHPYTTFERQFVTSLTNVTRITRGQRLIGERSKCSFASPPFECDLKNLLPI